MDIKITPHSLSGEVLAIPSKSDAHRALICAALSDSKTKIKIDSFSRDIDATIDCVCALGGNVEKHDDFLLVTPIKKGIKAPLLDCFESGSTLRFLLPVASVVAENPTFTGHGRLPKRPLSPLYEEMQSHGCTFTDKSLPLTIGGKLKGGTYHLAGNVSSQFISGLLFSLPLCEEDSKIVLTSPLESKGYVNMTLTSLKAFGIEIICKDNEYIIKGKQNYISPKEYTVEGDWSNAAFWLSAGAISGEINVKSLSLHSNQGDKEITDILKALGAEVEAFEKNVIVKKDNLKEILCDLTDIPDLAPIVSAVCAIADGRSVLKGLARLKIKESDRLLAIEDTLKRLGADICATDDSLTINGKRELTGGEVFSYNDHRIVMMAAIVATRCKNPVIIRGFEAVEKSYPDFFIHYKSLGGVFDVL